MSVSIIIPCGYLSKTETENDRLIKFTKQLQSFQFVDFNRNDELIFIEQSPNEKLLKIIYDFVKKINVKISYSYLKPKKEDGEHFNQSLCKNEGIKIARNENLLFINSDIILKKDSVRLVDKILNENPKSFIICARHDIFLDNVEINEDFFQEINKEENYRERKINLEDTGWYYSLKNPYSKKIETTIKLFTSQKYINKLNYDFLSGYIVFGDFFAYKKEYALQYQFDEKCLALTDVFIRDRLFSNIENLELKMLHESTSCFHLSGKDYQEQIKKGSNKNERLMKDHEYLSDKYEELRVWRLFGFHKEYIEWLNRYFTKEQVKELFEKYATNILKQYFTDKKEFEQEYGIKL